MNNFQWMSKRVEIPAFLNFEIIERWLVEVASSHGKLVGDIGYIFCDDDEILEVNRSFLNHDYYTDIITFDRSTRGLIRGDIYISLATVESNAEQQKTGFADELHRVIAHGVLHLCGIDDKGPGEREIMEREENKALNLLANHLKCSSTTTLS